MPSNFRGLSAAHPTCSDCRCSSQLAHTGSTPCNLQAARNSGSRAVVGHTYALEVVSSPSPPVACPPQSCAVGRATAAVGRCRSISLTQGEFIEPSEQIFFVSI
uniref:Uncharacterized protein n=1 Tax=Solanum lycopersicum TaxID=4081 RepID=A0A3Q7EBW8_SOLLC